MYIILLGLYFCKIFIPASVVPPLTAIESAKSLGSFFDIEPVSGFYSIHLPYAFLFINNIIKKVENWLNSSNKLTFLIWAPININVDGFIITRKILLEDL